MSTVAQTILDQLGGPRFSVMTGAKNYVGGQNSLSFKLGGGARYQGKIVSHFRITLLPSDTYRLEALAIRKAEVKVIATAEDIYVDNLRETFTRLTGFDTHL